MILKLGIRHWRVALYKAEINDDPWLTLTYFMTMSNLVFYSFEWGKTVVKSLNSIKLQTMTELTDDLYLVKGLPPGGCFLIHLYV